jgi:Cu/Ag efflux protein CusF
MNMNKINFAVFVALLISATAAFAQERTPLSVTEAVTVKATIEEIDKENRIVTLRGPRGYLIDVKADESIKRFDELKVGDVVSATYSESIAVHVRKPGEPEPDKERVIVRPQSKPGASVEDVRTMTVTVEEVDRSVPSVTIKDSQGNVRSYRVRDPQRLEGVKVGDKVDIYYTVALLLKVD